MTQPGIEPWSPRPLANTLPTSNQANIYIYIYICINIKIPNGSEEIYLGFTFLDHQDKTNQRGLGNLRSLIKKSTQPNKICINILPFID